MSFFKSLFGRTPKGADTPVVDAGKATKEIEHKGFVIRAMPYREQGQFQTAGLIMRSADGVSREQRFVRADRFASIDEATEFALSKGCQIVDEQGEGLFG